MLQHLYGLARVSKQGLCACLLLGYGLVWHGASVSADTHDHLGDSKDFVSGLYRYNDGGMVGFLKLQQDEEGANFRLAVSTRTDRGKSCSFSGAVHLHGQGKQTYLGSNDIELTASKQGLNIESYHYSHCNPLGTMAGTYRLIMPIAKLYSANSGGFVGAFNVYNYSRAGLVGSISILQEFELNRPEFIVKVKTFVQNPPANQEAKQGSANAVCSLHGASPLYVDSFKREYLRLGKLKVYTPSPQLLVIDGDDSKYCSNGAALTGAYILNENSNLPLRELVALDRAASKK